MKDWITAYVKAQKAALDSIPADTVAQLIGLLQQALKDDRQLFVFGNRGSAANASHFVTDLGKGSSDKIGKRFRCLSLNDNLSWMTALGNHYTYDDVLVLSVSGNSPNVVRAIEWSRKKGLTTIALVGKKRGRLAELAEHVIVIDSEHYGRVEDAHMGICHMLCYAFIENPALGRS